MRLFVYGTLLRGERNHRHLAHARLVDAHVTQPRFTLLDLGAYPGLVASGAPAVHGEIYEVDAATLRALDRFEGHPNLFRRGPLAGPVAGLEAYFLAPDEEARALSSGRAVVLESGSFRRLGRAR